ncbi:hypothetical protein PINS_up014650 [Pythium insidiosum]|nr:hypothetical protein PINS_up014650 [Pythium insidiosum]
MESDPPDRRDAIGESVSDESIPSSLPNSIENLQESLAARVGILEEREVLVVSDTIEDLTTLSREVDNLGPMEDLDKEVFDLVVRDVDGHGRSRARESITTKEIVVCKFCKSEFTYLLRELHDHKSRCTNYQQAQMEAIEENNSTPPPQNVIEDTQAPGTDDEHPDIEMDTSPDPVDDDKRIDDNGVDDADSGQVQHKEEHPGVERDAPEEQAVNEDNRTSGDDDYMINDTGLEMDAVEDRSPLIHDQDDTDQANEVVPRSSTVLEMDEVSSSAPVLKVAQKPTDNKKTRALSVEDTRSTPATITPKKKQAKRRIPVDEALPRDEEQVTPQLQEQWLTDFQPLRRSKRLKTDARHADERHSLRHEGEGVNPGVEASGGVVGQFEPVESSTKAKRWRCKHCGDEVAYKRAQAERHLMECAQFAEHRAHQLELEAQSVADSVSSGGRATHATPRMIEAEVTHVGPADTHTTHAITEDRDPFSRLTTMDKSQALAWLFGSTANADDMKQHYHRSSVMVEGSVDRFDALVKGPLRGLDVKSLLYFDATTVEGAMILVETQDAGVRRCAEIAAVSSKQAWDMYCSGFSIWCRPPLIVNHFISSIVARDLGVDPLATSGTHDVKLYCSRASRALDWQFHRRDIFVIGLQGQVGGRLRRTDVKMPVQCFHPVMKSVEEAEEHFKAQRLVLNDQTTTVAAPFEDMHWSTHDDGEDPAPRASGQQDEVVDVKPGSVLYIPAGTWFTADTLDNAIWLQVQVHATTYADVMSEAVRQLLWRNPACREPLIATKETTKSMRQHMSRALSTLARHVEELHPSDIVPELLLHTEDEMSGDAVMLDDPQTGFVGKSFEFDLCDHESFKGGSSVKIFKNSTLRVNPLAVLMNLDELPHGRSTLPVKGSRTVPNDGGDLTAVAVTPVGEPSNSKGSTSKKAQARKPKRKLSIVTAPKRQDRRGYVLHLLFGNEEYRSRLRVKFRCDAFQHALLEWTRNYAPGEAFHVFELMKLVSSGGLDGVPADVPHDEDALRYILRFLCSIGYLTQVKFPL